jgi:hypothetical protein
MIEVHYLDTLAAHLPGDKMALSEIPLANMAKVPFH